jgi:hypothetical protein
VIVFGVLNKDIVKRGYDFSIERKGKSVFLINVINNSFSSDIKCVRVSCLVIDDGIGDFCDSESGGGFHDRAFIAIRSALGVDLKCNGGNFIYFGRVFDIGNKENYSRVFGCCKFNIYSDNSRANYFIRDIYKSFKKVTG